MHHIWKDARLEEKKRRSKFVDEGKHPARNYIHHCSTEKIKRKLCKFNIKNFYMWSQHFSTGSANRWRSEVPVWVRMCSFRVLNLVNIFSHSPHLYGLSSLCTGRWTLRSVDRANLRPHSSHWNGFSPGRDITSKCNKTDVIKDISSILYVNISLGAVTYQNEQ
jgi:hypothetical protein